MRLGPGRSKKSTGHGGQRPAEKMPPSGVILGDGALPPHGVIACMLNRVRLLVTS